MNPIVHAENISRFYGMILGLNNVSFTIRPGITGIVGPNGAGKTTLFRLVLGQIQPSAGTLTVFGERPWNNPAVQARIAYCPESEVMPAGLRPLAQWFEGRDIAIKHRRFGHPAGPYAEAARVLLREHAADVVVMGHTHVPHLHALPEGRMVNTGSCSGGRFMHVSIDTAARTVEIHTAGGPGQRA